VGALGVQGTAVTTVSVMSIVSSNVRKPAASHRSESTAIAGSGSAASRSGVWLSDHRGRRRPL
jgi:hypothetical protein